MIASASNQLLSTRQQFVDTSLRLQAEEKPRREPPLSRWHFEQEFARVCRLRTVRKVVFVQDAEDPTLCVITEPILCKHPKTGIIKELGRFCIGYHIKLGEPQWLNLDRTVEVVWNRPGAERELATMYAPHIVVDDSARTCLGDARNDFTNYHTKGRASLFLMLGIRFVECVNPECNVEGQRALAALSEFPNWEEGHVESSAA